MREVVFHNGFFLFEMPFVYFFQVGGLRIESRHHLWNTKYFFCSFFLVRKQIFLLNLFRRIIKKLKAENKNAHACEEHIVKRYGYTNVDAFMQVYRATKKVKDSYERKLADWNDKYGQYAESDAKPRKSTLMRLLLGFETPQKGLITYDKKDIMKLDTASLRKKIGVVLQDGKLFMGDIYSNIVISAPQLTVEDAWKAAEIASIA
ncbi:MAG: ATP-binding cassette domain-containing protein, partial [Lachnospiraceae bacterium]|nr:ATP-binding cassette domain-containing protein [Candidatus Colinaster equi]